MLVRIIIAVLVAILINAILVPLLRVIGFPDVSSDVILIIRACIAGIAILYILRGPSIPPLTA